MSTSPSNIPAEAVEAATKAFRETRDMGDALMNALEAAAPHMLGAAWAEGCRKGLGTNPGWEDEVLARNPYRPTL